MENLIFESPIGLIELVEENGYIINLNFIYDTANITKVEKLVNKTLMKAKEELLLYFNKELKSFSIKTKQNGTEFQQSVWEGLKEVEYGQTRSYKDLATIINKPNACRAVGTALGKNKIPIIIPCHRIVNENGNIGGFGLDINIKKYLLALEEE